MTECIMAPFERDILATAEYFVATAFRGRGVFDRSEHLTRKEAVQAARSLVKDRPALVYAVRGYRQACTDIVNA